MNKLVSLLLIGKALAAQNPEEIFTKIYNSWFWDQDGFTLSGSQIEITRDYFEFLQRFLRENEIKTVVDIGCGDWAFSRYIDWSEIEYIGIDIVSRVIDWDIAHYQAPNIQFLHANALEMDLPKADLLICKDLFQHLSNQDIFKILKQAGKYKHCLFTDFISPLTLSSNNADIETGGYHFLDLRKPPFNLNGKQVLLFNTTSLKHTLHYQALER